MKYLGIDYGEKFIGLALADTESNVSMPLEIIRNHTESESIDKLIKLISEYKIDKVIVGKPHWHDDSQIKVIEKFVDKFMAKIEVDIDFVDESLTTKMVDNLPGVQPNNSRVDDLSAMIILQAYLDSKE